MSPEAEDTVRFQWRLEVAVVGLRYSVVVCGKLQRAIPTRAFLLEKLAEIQHYMLENKGSFNVLEPADIGLAVADKFKLHYVKVKDNNIAVELYC